MLDLFTIFSKGGIVLWCFQSTSQIFTPSVNALIKSVILQERTGLTSYDDGSLTLKYRLDNEFELVFVVAFQKILQLSYVDKFLDDIHLEFRDKYKNELSAGHLYDEFDFETRFRSVLRNCEEWGKTQALLPKTMRKFEDSQKSKKTVSSMIERKGDDSSKKKGKATKQVVIEEPEVSKDEAEPVGNGTMTAEDEIMANRAKLAQKIGSPNAKKGKQSKSPKSPKEGKKPRIWELGGSSKDLPDLERTKDRPLESHEIAADLTLVGQMKGSIKDLEVDSDSEEFEEDSEEEEKPKRQQQPANKSRGVFSMFKSLVGSKNLTKQDMESVLDKLKDHLITKNVAADIANKLCDSVAAKLEGKVLGTFDSVATTVKTTMTESLVQILSPTRRVDILRDALEAKRSGRPFTMAFCGVNGVGKSTNLAKICFWLIENNLSVLIAACDTFRAGAVEQLRTHMRHLNALHPPEKHNGVQMVRLYEKGYGKDAAGIAMEAIIHAKESKTDIVLIDTAGRMQDNEPLMRALAKLVKVNEPDLVLFVGEALVGNEAVDQLTKFNQSLADFSQSTKPHLIDGIVLTKFDTIDDKVGAAISMTYMTGQPIVFVGTGQTYTDLKSLNAKAVVSALMK
uniref:Signal recognition particle receptor subunit alpha n=1 Tax=Lygus hesperus TaxID=30085 RepID=A0A0A9Y262_LYGHE